MGPAGTEWVEWHHYISLSLRIRTKIRLTGRIWGWTGNLGAFRMLEVVVKATGMNEVMDSLGLNERKLNHT